MSENETPIVEDTPYLSPLIDDGYSKTSVIPGRAGLWSPVRLRWRKLTAEQIDTVVARFYLDSTGGKCKHYADEVAPVRDAKGIVTKKGNIIAWDMKDAQGQPVAVTADSIRSLDYGFYQELLAVLSGDKPEWEEPAKGPEGTSGNELKN